jgi:hypothetical protein
VAAPGRVAVQLHALDASVQRLVFGELDARTMRQAFAG